MNNGSNATRRLNTQKKDDPTHSSSDSSNNKKEYKLYSKRWLMLFYISLLNLLSDWTCYSVAPISLLTNEAFGTISPTFLVVSFLFANGLSTSLEPKLLSILGLRRIILLGSFLQMFGSVVKSGGIPYIMYKPLLAGDDEWKVYLGFILVGLSQPLFQCTPALLSSSWFPEKERTLATGVALNSNQLGIGCAFMFGTIWVKSSEDIPKYFSFLSMFALVLFVGVWLHFEDCPKTKPSETARVVRGNLGLRNTEQINDLLLNDDNASDTQSSLFVEKAQSYNVFWMAKLCLGKPGFTHSLVTFAVSAIVINTLSTYMDYLIQLQGGTKALVGMIGGAFQLLVMLSSLAVGRQTDRTRAYFSVIIALLLLGAFALAACGISLDDNNGWQLSWTLLIVAMLVGPLQPVATELGVDVCYPMCENSVLVVMQLVANMSSALFVPFFHMLKDVGVDDRPEYSLSFYLLIVLHALTCVYFATFNGKYMRLEYEKRRDCCGSKPRDNSSTGERQPLLGIKAHGDSWI